jgi:hypothetical protein
MSPQIAAISRCQLIGLMQGMRANQKVWNQMKARSTAAAIGPEKTTGLNGSFRYYRIEANLQVVQKNDDSCGSAKRLETSATTTSHTTRRPTSRARCRNSSHSSLVGSRLSMAINTELSTAVTIRNQKARAGIP